MSVNHIPPAYEVCGAEYSFRLSARSSVLPVLTFYFKVLHEVFFIHQEMVRAGGIRAPLGTCSSF